MTFVNVTDPKILGYCIRNSAGLTQTLQGEYIVHIALNCVTDEDKAACDAALASCHPVPFKGVHVWNNYGVCIHE